MIFLTISNVSSSSNVLLNLNISLRSNVSNISISIISSFFEITLFASEILMIFIKINVVMFNEVTIYKEKFDDLIRDRRISQALIKRRIY